MIAFTGKGGDASRRADIGRKHPRLDQGQMQLCRGLRRELERVCRTCPPLGLCARNRWFRERSEHRNPLQIAEHSLNSFSHYVRNRAIEGKEKGVAPRGRSRAVGGSFRKKDQFTHGALIVSNK
jgi:hypothetical protein